MSEVDVSALSPVRLRAEGLHRTWVVAVLCPLLVVAFISNLADLLRIFRGSITDPKTQFEVWVLFLAPIWGCIRYSGEWLNLVRKVTLNGEALQVSTRIKRFTIPLEGVTECEIAVAKVKGRIEITVGVIPPGGKDFLKVYFIRKIDPVKDLQLLPALQRRGIRLVGIGEFQREIERLTGKSASGLFGASGALEATSLN